ncbi:hypothetical protein FRB94_000095 [Tulasnella sp. JGI-2019a]|nr:hypothetical protein FRB94_000095 [Tulasnella sp. JGI-2019a]
MLSFLRSNVPRTNTAAQNPLVFEDGRGLIQFHTPESPYMMRHTLPPASVPTFMKPPLHLHLFQVEHFQVVSGVGAFFLRPSASNPTPAIVRQGETIEIPVGAYHRFENGSEQPLVVDIRLDPQNWRMEESFFRNFFGYLEDCRVHGKEPSILQIFVFLESVEAPLAIPLPDWVGETARIWVSRGLMTIGAAVGRLVGYQPSYDEYFRERAE